MTQNIQVKCLTEIYWDPSTRDWDGEWVDGTLIDISTQTADDNSGKLIPVAVVLLDDNTFECVPMEFILKIETK